MSTIMYMHVHVHKHALTCMSDEAMKECPTAILPELLDCFPQDKY